MAEYWPAFQSVVKSVSIFNSNVKTRSRRVERRLLFMCELKLLLTVEILTVETYSPLKLILNLCHNFSSITTSYSFILLICCIYVC